MASGVYGRRVADSHISDHALFAQDQYPITGADRALTTDLESVWDKVHDAKAVLQQLEHRIEVTEDGKKAEDLALSVSEENSPKKALASSQHQLSSTMKRNNQSKPTIRSVGHKVAFHEPVVSYNEEYDPLHGSNAGAIENLGGTVSSIHDGNKSFIVRDFRTNNFDTSRVTVRTVPSTQHSMMGQQSGQNLVPNGLHEEKNSPLKGVIVPTRVLNEEMGPGKRNRKTVPVRKERNMKSAGVAKTVTHFDADQVYKYLQKEGRRRGTENMPSLSGIPSSGVVTKSPLFQASPYGPYKNFDIVKQRKKMKQNSEALERLKEKIQRQKQRSPSTDTSPMQKPTHHEEDPVMAMETHINSQNEKQFIRKIARGPPAPEYKGFSKVETRLRSSVHPDKKPKAASSLFKADDVTSKQPITSGRLKPGSAVKQTKSANQKLVQKTAGKVKSENQVLKKSIITPSSWREGQRIAESILGPPPKQAKKTMGCDKQRPDSPPTRDTNTTQPKNIQSRQTTKPADIGSANSFASAAFKPPSGHAVIGKGEKTVAGDVNVEDVTVDGGKKSTRMNSSVKASIPADKLSVEARGVLDELHLSSSESDSEKEDVEHQSSERPMERKLKERRGRHQRSAKHHLSKDEKEAKTEKFQKVRHYDQSEVQQYMAKQKADRKRKQSQERKAHKEAQQRKQKQLEQLYKKQKEVSGKRKLLEYEGKSRPLKQVDLAAVQAIHKMDRIIDGTVSKPMDANESDKENSQSRRQPLARFDEKMTAFMAKLNQYETSVPPTSTYLPPNHKQIDKKTTGESTQPQNKPTSEFMQKLDRYLREETPVTAVSKVSGPALAEMEEHTVEDGDDHGPDLTVEDLGRHETSPYRSETFMPPRDRYGDPSGSHSLRFRQTTPAELPGPSEEFVSQQRARAERIAALKVQAETLQERLQTESRKLVEQPIVPIKPRLEEIDAILAKSGHGQSLPIHAWTPETRVSEFRDTGSRWRTSKNQGYGGVDVPDSGCSRAGLTEFSPSQLPGVAGLRKHVTDVEKKRSETDAALKIQSAYRGHSVRQAMDEWKLPSGRSLTEVRRQATSVANLKDDRDTDDDHSISEGPLTSRSESQRPDSPIKLRSVEEILADMKKKEYCVADPPPIEELLSNKWKEPATDYMDSPRSERSRHDFLSDLRPGASSAYDEFRQQDEEKPPWERSGGDKYSVVNVFAKKYLRAMNENQKHEETDASASGKVDTQKSSVSEVHISPKHKSKSEGHPPHVSYSEHFEASFSKKSPRTKSSEKNSPRFDDTARDALETLSSLSEELPVSKRSATSKQLAQKQATDSTVPKTVNERQASPPSQVLIGRTSYSSDDESSKASDASSESATNRPDTAREAELHHPDDSDLALDKSDSILAPMPNRIPPKFPSVPVSSEKKFSPAALEQKMSAELNYQEAIEESLRHLSGVERTQGVSLAQQETVSLAQLMKARELQHNVEMERLTLKAKEEALDSERKKAAARAGEDEKRSKENLKMQEASRKALETQAEAARSTAEAAKQLARTLGRKPVQPHQDSYSAASSEQSSRRGSFSTSESIRTREPASESSSDAEKRGKKSPRAADWKKHDSPPSMMSEHSTTSVRMSDNDTQSSIPEQMPSTEEEDDKKGFKKLPLDKKTKSPDTSATESISEELPKMTPTHDSDKSMSEDIPSQPRQDKIGKKKHSSKENKDPASDSSETSSVHFDESLTEDEIAEISRRAVVPSEIHRQHQRRRSPHTGHLDRSDLSSDDQPSISKQKTPRSGGHRALEEFTIGPSLAGAADSEFVHFMDEMVQQYMMEEEVRSKHQAAMLKLRERAIKEKTEAELAWLEKMKKQVRNKGEDEKMPPIKKKQRAILRRFKMETDEIKKLKAVTKAASQERRLFLQQRKDNAARRAKLRATEDKPDPAGEGMKPRKDDAKEPPTSSTPVPNINLSDLPDLDISESNSELDISSASSIMLKQLKTRTFDEHRLTKREQRLMQRKRQAEQLIAWKKRLDQEEKKVCDIEKQALSAWEKEGGGKPDKARHPTTAEGSSKETDVKLSPKTDSSRESSIGKSPGSEHQSSPPPPSHSESSIAEEVIPIHSGTNSSRSVVSPEQTNESHRNQEESSDGTNADDYSQSFESVTGSQRTPRSPKSRDKEEKSDKAKETKTTELKMPVKKEKKDDKRKPSDADSPSATPLLHSKRDEPSSQPTTLKSDSPGKELISRRRESAESWSDESFSQTQSETEQSDIECRVRALKEELKRRRMIAEKLKKEQKRRHKDRLKAQEASLRSQIEAYDVFIRKTQNELTQELDNQLHSAAPVGPVAKPQIRSPRKSELAKQSARGLRGASASVVSPEASPRSGSHRPAILGKHRTESESSGKSSRSLSFDDEERPDDVTPNGSTKSFPGVVASLPSKHQEKLPSSHTVPSSQQIHDSLSSGGSTPTEKRLEKPKRLDLTAAVATLSKLTVKPLSPNGFAVSSTTSAEKPKSHIPVASKTSSPPSSKSSPSASLKTPPSPANQVSPKSLSLQPSRKSLIPLPVSTSSQEPAAAPTKSKEAPAVTSPPSPLPSEKSLAYSEDFESSVSKRTQEESSITTDEDISEHFSDVSGTSGEKSDKSGAILDLAIPSEKRKGSPEPSKDDSLHGVEELGESKERPKEQEESDDDDEKTPVISPAQTPIPSSPRTPTPDIRDSGLSAFDVGDRVLLAGRETGIVRFVGETSFAPGVWVGAELQKPNGKNDGSVNGVRYFTCSPKHGIFAPIARVSLVSPKSHSTASSRSSSSRHFEYGEEAMNAAKEEKLSESELGKAISEASRSFETFAKDVDEDLVAPMETEPMSPKKTSPVKTGVDRNRLADELSDRLLSSLLEDSMTHLLSSHADKRQRQSKDVEENQEAKRRKREDQRDEEDETPQSSDEDDIALSSSTRKLLEMLASSPEQTQEPVAEDEDDKETKTKEHESLADTFTGDLLQDTLTKVLEIRRQRAKKWKQMEEGEDDFDEGGDAGEDVKLDDGREVEDILDAQKRKQGTDDEDGEDKESTTPVRPVSPIFGASQDEGLEEWFEDDIGISSFHKKKPTLSKDDIERLKDEEDLWQDGRLIEVLSSRIEPPQPPPKFVVPHRPEHILRLVEDAVDYYYSKYLRGELTSDARIPDFLFKDKPDELSDKDSDESDQEKKEADINANHIFKTSIFDMVREIITEIYSTKSHAEEMSQRPIWLKKRPVVRPSYCRRIPKTGEELLAVVSQQVSKLLNLSGDAHKLDPRITMKWGSRKKKDKVDLILIQELREEEPEWTNYDEDETTVKMQLTDTVLDMLLSDTVKCLDGIERKREQRESVVVPTGEEFVDGEERSQ